VSALAVQNKRCRVLAPCLVRVDVLTLWTFVVAREDNSVAPLTTASPISLQHLFPISETPSTLPQESEAQRANIIAAPHVVVASVAFSVA